MKYDWQRLETDGVTMKLVSSFLPCWFLIYPQKEAAKADPEPQQVMEILRQFMKQDKTLEDDPFYAVAYKATSAAASNAAKVAAVAQATAIAEADRAARAAEARKKAAETAAMAAAEAKKHAAAAAAATAAASAASATTSQTMASAKTSTISLPREARSQPLIAVVAIQGQVSVDVVAAPNQVSSGVSEASAPLHSPAVALATRAPLVGEATAGAHAPPGN